MNNQKIEKKLKFSTGEVLSIVGVFSTIQGEGPFTGHRAIFIRLAGCNLQCPGCDTDYTTGRYVTRYDDIVEEVQELNSGQPHYLVVITGGEPFRQEIAPLANNLIWAGFQVQIETNGTYAPSPDLSKDVVIVCSPKTGSINKKLAERADCFKYVMHADSVAEDGLPVLALGHTAHPKVARPPGWMSKPIYLQPMDSKDHEQNRLNIKAVQKSCLEHGYILQLQTHKIIGVE